MKYNIRLHNNYTTETYDESVDLYDFKFCIANDFDNKKFHIYDIWTVIENSSSPENKKFIEQFETVGNSITYELPFDVTVLSMWNIEFLDDKFPEFITTDEMNNKLMQVKTNAVWVDLQIPDLFIMSVYKLAYINAPDDVVIAEIPYKNFYGDEVKYKSLRYSNSCKLHVIQEHVSHMSDSMMTKLLTGNEAQTLWSSLIDKVLLHSDFNPDKIEPMYNFNRCADEFKIIAAMVNNPEKFLKEMKDDEENNDDK